MPTAVDTCHAGRAVASSDTAEADTSPGVYATRTAASGSNALATSYWTLAEQHRVRMEPLSGNEHPFEDHPYACGDAVHLHRAAACSAATAAASLAHAARHAARANCAEATEPSA